MSQDTDASNAVVRSPVAWILALVAGVAADWLYPLRFVPASVGAAWVGGAIFAIAFALAIWAIVTIRKAGTRVETYKPTTAIVMDGPYRFTRNPIYLGWSLARSASLSPSTVCGSSLRWWCSISASVMA